MTKRQEQIIWKELEKLVANILDLSKRTMLYEKSKNEYLRETGRIVLVTIGNCYYSLKNIFTNYLKRDNDVHSLLVDLSQYSLLIKSYEDNFEEALREIEYALENNNINEKEAKDIENFVVDIKFQFTQFQKDVNIFIDNLREFDR